MNIARDREWARDTRSMVLPAKLLSTGPTFRSGRFVAICIAGVALAGLALIVTEDAPMNSTFYGVAFGLMVVLGLLPTAIRYHGRPYDWVSPVTLFSASYAFVFTFGSIYQAAGIIPLTRAWSIEDFPSALFYAVLGLAGFQIGYYRVPWRHLPMEANVRSWPWERAVVAYYGLLIIVWAIRLYLAVLGVGSGRVHFATTRDLSFWETFLMQGALHLSFGIIPSAVVLSRRHGNQPLQVLVRTGIVAEFLYWVLVSWRSQFLINAITLIVAFLLLTPRVRIRMSLLIGVIILIALPVVDTMRVLLSDEEGLGNPWAYVATEVLPRSVGETFRDPSAYGRAASNVYVEMRGRLNPLDFFSEVIGPVQAQGYMLGETLVANLWVLVPRIVWPDKPSATGAKNMIQERYGLREEDTMLTQPLELYANAGPVGVILGMIVIGLLYRAIFQVSLLRYPGPEGVFLYSVTMILYVFHERDIFNSTADFLRIWVLFWVIVWWIGLGRNDVRGVAGWRRDDTAGHHR